VKIDRSYPHPPRRRKTSGLVLLLMPLFLAFLLPGCHVWRIEKGLKEMGREIEEAGGLGMKEAALYHLSVAGGLLEAAEEQYEQADFNAAAQFLDQSERHLERARRLHGLRRSAPRSPAGGEP